ncbi:MAG: cation transporter [Gammaproteobacteria bacterium]|nr:cation transporter [Gammaproteobacteria bacterium]
MAGQHQHTSSLTSSKALFITTALISFFAVAEALGGWWANSLALLSDAGHMAADAAALLLAAFAAWIAKRPPSPKLSYGYGRAEVLGASISSLVLILIVIAIVVAALSRFKHHDMMIHSKAVIVIAFIGLVINMVAIWILSSSEKTMNTRAAMLHIFSDALGSVAALLTGIIITFTHWMAADPIFSLFISLLILIASIRLLRETFSVLMEGVPYDLNLTEIGEQMTKISSNIASIHDLHIWTLSTGNVMLTAHLLVNELALWQKDLQQLQKMLAERFSISHITLQPESNEFPLTPFTKPLNDPVD